MPQKPLKWQNRTRAPRFKRWWCKHPAASTAFAGVRSATKKLRWTSYGTPAKSAPTRGTGTKWSNPLAFDQPFAKNAKTRRSGFCARRGTRTLTSLRTLDPESSLSTNFSTRACLALVTEPCLPLEPLMGLEPTTLALRMRCSTN